MIWELAREQVRSQRRYIAWAVVVVVLAVGVATYGALVANELNRAAETTNHALVLDTEHGGFAYVDLVDHLTTASSSRDTVNTALASADAKDVRYAAHAVLPGVVLETTPSGDFPPRPVALSGDIGWDSMLIDGHAPATGEVALSKAYAILLGVGLGDTISFYLDGAPPAPLGIDATVSGITRSPFRTSGLSLESLNDVWVSWDDLGAFGAATQSAGADDWATGAEVTLTWDGNSPELNRLAGNSKDDGSIYGVQGDNATTLWVNVTTAVLVIGAISMAFAFGRAQAQARTQWVATARALGASRRHVVLATVLEACVVAVAGWIGGYLLGTVGATLHLTLVHAQVPGAGIAAYASFSPIVALGGLVLALVLSLVVAGVPAFWGARVSPSAALKPENDITTAEVGRRVRFWPVTFAWLATGALAALTADTHEVQGGPLYAVLLKWLFVILSFIVANEALRGLLPGVGSWLSRRRSRVALVAGDSISARPRQFTVPALLAGLGTAALLVPATAMIIQQSGGWDPLDPSYEEIISYVWPAWIEAGSLIVMGAITVLATIIAIATSSVTARERATREALGVTPNQTRVAAGFAQLVTLATGIATGLVIALGISLVFLAFTPLNGAGVAVDWGLAARITARATGLVVLVGVLFAVVSSLIIFLVSRTPRVPGLPSAHRKTANVNGES